MLPVYKNQPTDFFCKSLSRCLFNENTGLKLVKWNSWKSCWSFKFRPQGKPFQGKTQPKLNIFKTFKWRPGHDMNILCIFTGILLSFGMGPFKIINFWKSFCWSLKKPLNSDWVRAVFCMLINIQCCYYLRWTKCQKTHFL